MHRLDRPARWVGPGSLALLTIAVYARVAGYDFVNYDDFEYVTMNPHVNGGVTVAGVRWAFTSAYAANWHPLTWLSHMLDCQLFGLEPGAHHLTNLALHVANALVLLRVLDQMTGARWQSAFVAALFALHPMHVESVAWIAERKDVLSTLFWMLALDAWMRWVEQPGAGRYVLALLLFALGLLAKPMVVTFPGVLLLLDWWPLRRMSRGRLRGLVIEKLPFVLLAVAAAAVTVVVQRAGGAIVATAAIPIGARVANVLVSYVRYLASAAVPVGLAFVYPYRAWPAWIAAGAGLLLLAITAITFRLGRRRPYLVVGWLWYLTTLLPVIGFVPIGQLGMADRYTYVPFVGLFIMVAWGVPDLIVRGRHLAAAGGLAVAACAVATAVQVGYWRDSRTLFERALRVTRDNQVAHDSLGNVLFVEGKYEDARAQYAEAVRISPGYTTAHRDLGRTLAALGRLDAAVAEYREAARERPDDPRTHVELGNALAQQGHLDAAAAEYATAGRLDPGSAEARNNLGVALAGRGDVAGAIAAFRDAVRVDPGYASAHFNLARALEDDGRQVEAVEHYAAAARLEGRKPEPEPRRREASPD